MDDDAAPESPRLSREEAFELGAHLQSLATRQARMEHDFCQLVDQFDAGEGSAWFDGILSTAHYLGWACSLSPGPAREHVRVARALRQMPRVKALFAQGVLSYSKVRELTRVAGQVDDQQLCELAEMMTASQLARTISSFRTAAGTRIVAEQSRRFTTTPTGDGMVRLSLVLPAEQAAVITAAVEAATRELLAADVPAGTSRPAPDEVAQAPRPFPTTADRLQALVDVAASYLDTRPSVPEDDHTLVVVHVSAEQLGDVPAGTSAGSTSMGSLRSGTCHVEGHGPIEAATAQRLLCTSPMLGAVVDRHGQVLALGRTRRLATRAQRRALRIRDHGVCQFPGCHRDQHLDAHHLVPWSHGGPTDIGNLVLLCRRHHTLTHEGGLRLSLTLDPWRRLQVELPDGTPITGTWREAVPLDQLERQLAERATTAAEPSKTTVFPLHGGAAFHLHECVSALFQMARAA